jgi:hypothetical protein
VFDNEINTSILRPSIIESRETLTVGEITINLIIEGVDCSTLKPKGMLQQTS